MLEKPTRRVLIVDDNEEAAELLQMLLVLEGYETRLAFSGAEGLATAESFRPHVICSDIGMPEMSGIEFGHALRASSYANNILLLAITGWSDVDTAADIIRAGYDYHFAKPVPSNSISDCLNKFFDAHPFLT
ncbi:MAG: response regulator [Cytophagaceae bacterium]|nr:MAG: response regulator [Cytophagaceae bacterium]